MWCVASIYYQHAALPFRPADRFSLINCMQNVLKLNKINSALRLYSRIVFQARGTIHTTPQSTNMHSASETKDWPTLENQVANECSGWYNYVKLPASSIQPITWATQELEIFSPSFLCSLCKTHLEINCTLPALDWLANWHARPLAVWLVFSYWLTIGNSELLIIACCKVFNNGSLDLPSDCNERLSIRALLDHLITWSCSCTGM